ncbi:MAG: hypothetical protein ABJN22_13780 [Litorimonas sp.]
MMTLTKKLSELIATHMSRPGHVTDAPVEADFVMSGLRAAGSSNMITRRKILSDVSQLLDCKSEDLEFLFTEFAMPISSVPNYEVMVPDFQSQLLAIAE